MVVILQAMEDIQCLNLNLIGNQLSILLQLKTKTYSVINWLINLDCKNHNQIWEEANNLEQAKYIKNYKDLIGNNNLTQWEDLDRDMVFHSKVQTSMLQLITQVTPDLEDLMEVLVMEVLVQATILQWEEAEHLCDFDSFISY